MHVKIHSVDAALTVKCRLVRRSRNETILMIRSIPVRLECFTEEEAPAVLEIVTSTANGYASEDVPGGTRRVHLAGSTWLSPLMWTDGKPVEDVSMSGLVALARDQGRTWGDSPYGISDEVIACKRIDILPEAKVKMLECSTDIDVLASAMSRHLSRDLALVAGKPFRRRSPPVNTVTIGKGVQWNSKPCAPTIALNARFGPGGDRRSDQHATRLSFSPYDFLGARGFCRRLGAIHGVAHREYSGFILAGHPDGADSVRPDAGAVRRADLTSRLPAALAPFMGFLERDVVEQYLDARDIARGRGAGDLDEAMTRLFLMLADGSAGNREARYILQFHAARIEFETGRSGALFAAAERPSAFAALVESASGPTSELEDDDLAAL